MPIAETAQLIAELSLKDNLSGSLGRVNSQLSRLQSGAGQTAKGVGQLGAGLARVGVVAAGAAATGIGAAVKLAGDFEAQLNTINTVAQVTPDQLNAIGDSIRGLARSSGTSLSDLTGAYYDLVSAGIAASDAQNVLTQANTLAIGGLGTTAEAVDLLTTAINSYGGDASKAKQYTDEFAVAVANGKVTTAELAANFADVGPLAASMGVGIDQIAASIGQMTAKGTQAPEAFTQIRAAMVALQRQTPEMRKVMKDLGIENIQTELDSKGLAGTWDELRRKADELGIPLIKLTGRVEGQQYALQNTGKELKGYKKNLDDVRHASDGAGVAAEQMAQRQKGLNFALSRLKALASDAGITIGSKLLPKIVPLVEKLNEFINQNQDKISKFGDDLAAGFERLADGIKSADFSGLIDGFKLLSSISKGVVETFLKLPPQIQSIAIAGLALNKISGGLLAKGIGNIAGGLLKIGFERGSSPANPLFVSAVGGLGGGGGVLPGGGTGGIGKFFGMLSKIAIPVIVAEAAQQSWPTIFSSSQSVHDALGLPDLHINDLQWPLGQKNIPKWVYDIGLESGPYPGGGGRGSGGYFGPPGAVSARVDADITSHAASERADAQAADAAKKAAELSAKEFLAKLRTTAFIGAKDYKSIFEKFSTHPGRGTDPFGKGFLQLVQQLKNPKAPKVAFEIKGHLAELRNLEKFYVQHGDRRAAAKVQGVIDRVKELLGIERRGHDRTHAKLDRIPVGLRRVEGVDRDTARAARDTAHKTALAVERIRGVEAGTKATAANTDSIKRQGPPNVSVGVYNTISVSTIGGVLQRQSYTTGTGNQGGLIR